MKNYCVICHDKDPTAPFQRNVEAICNELNAPVCTKHALQCKKEGHGYRCLGQDDLPSIMPLWPKGAKPINESISTELRMLGHGVKDWMYLTDVTEIIGGTSGRGAKWAKDKVRIYARFGALEERQVTKRNFQYRATTDLQHWARQYPNPNEIEKETSNEGTPNQTAS